ncbi:leucine-rich repeat domain-containing protein [Aureispira anguillae]|uniref:Uncharacterized protein n=1 Tax=Aureispira anguillae TaxID=2864201 RepID=A0A915YEB3_9BACT|nr:hypothetical protein [Aureispira anguillae]BDS11534.1 hypothetical protein AsAng_0022480 [Aureispira anguillae]
MNEKKVQFSLTAENSHKIYIPLGQGSLAIGNIGMDKKDFDVLVDEKLAINWDTFNTHFTGHGEQNKDKYPYGDWPRFFYYSGNDLGFIKWTAKRKTENFSWTPQKSISADFTKANIRNLSIQSKDLKIGLKFGKNIENLSLSGSIEKFDIQSNDALTSLSIYPNISNDNAYLLPELNALKEITSLSVYVNPLEQPFDCKSLLQFDNLTHLNLSGNFINLGCLKSFNNLQSLAIRYAPNLENLPELKSWKQLTSFIAWNIEETKGKLLRSELRKLAKDRELEYSSVAQLRKKIWFTTEYGIPFSSWTGKEAKLAIKTYKATVKKLKKAKTERDIKNLLIEFTKTFNDFSNIETIEREDIGEAVNQLRQVPMLIIDADKANKWFDEVRAY